MGKFQEHKYNFETAAKKFRLIEEDTRTILVPVEQEAEELLAELKHQGFSKERMRKASQYCIQVYDNLFKILWDAGMIQEISSDATEFYELVKLDQYTEDMGLDLSVDSGMDLFCKEEWRCKEDYIALVCVTKKTIISIHRWNLTIVSINNFIFIFKNKFKVQ